MNEKKISNESAPDKIIKNASIYNHQPSLKQKQHEQLQQEQKIISTASFQSPIKTKLIQKKDKISTIYDSRVSAVSVAKKYLAAKKIKKDYLKINGYLFVDKLDSGGFGTVYKAEKDGETVAVKVIKFNPNIKGLDSDLRRELAVLVQVEHENIVHCYDIMRTAHRVYIFMEFASGGTLGKYVRKYGPLPEWGVRQLFFAPVVDALIYLEGLGIAHRDLKLDNILLDDVYNPKLTDFGLSRYCQRDKNGNILLASTHCGTESYMSPEILQRKRYDPFIADCWSLGVCLYVMLADCYPFDRKDQVTMIKKMQNRDWHFPAKIRDNISSLCVDLLKRILEPNVEQRIHLRSIPSHPWMPKLKPSLVSRTVEVHVYDQQTELGGTALLRCVYPIELRSYVRVSGWLSDDGLIILPPASSTADPYLLVQRRYNVLSTGELIISKVDERDANRRFRCQVINILTGERFESASWTRLTLTVRNIKPSSPVLNIAESTLTQPKTIFLVKPGDTLFLACLFTSNPTASVIWQQHRIDNDSNHNYSNIYRTTNTGNLLLIPSITLEDISHIWVCTANNSFGHARLELQLKLQNDLRIEMSSSSPNAQLDKAITLNCSYVYTGEKYKVIWYKNMQQIQIDGLEITSGQYNSNNNSNLIIHWIKINSFKYTDSGVYQCFLRSTSSTHHQQQQQRYPVLSSITYSKPITANIQTTELNKDQLSSNTIYLTIKEKEPKFLVTFNEQLKLHNNELSLKCTSTGIPLPTISWWINGLSVSSTRLNIENTQLDSQTVTSTLNISSLTVSDSGFYSCVAMNINNEHQQTITNEARINVMGSIGINLSSSNRNLTAVVGRLFSLNCPFYGYPIEKITFYKNEKKILTDERRQERSPGKLIIQSIRKEDEGNYKCIITGVTGEKNEANMYLKVLSPPIISPFEFPVNLEEDMRTSLICSVTSGDPPVTMSWLRNNQLITNNDQSGLSNNLISNSLTLSHSNMDNNNNKLQFQVVSLNQFVSSLLINKLSPEYTGTYTCVAKNEVATANHSTYLQVKSRTRFGLKPLSRQVSILGEGVRFDCQAIGFPQPVIRWKYLGSSSLLDNRALVQLLDSRVDFSGTNSGYLSSNNVQSVSILSNPRVHVLENGSLIIKSVQLEDEGTYMCEASNGIGRQVEAYAALLVFSAPRVKMSFDFSKTTNGLHQNILNHRLSSSIFNTVTSNLNTISIKKGDQASFTCSALGSQPLNVQWTHNGILLPNTNTENIAISNSNTKDLIYSINEQLTNDQLKQSTLTIKLNARNSSGIIRCQATNFFSNNVESGTTEAVVKVLLLEQPGSPVLKTTEINARSSIIQWIIDYTGNSIITGYEIQYKKIFLTSKQQLEYNKIKFNHSLINQSNDSDFNNLTDLNLLFKKLRKDSNDEEFWNQANVQFVTSSEVQETNNNLQASNLNNNNKKLALQLIGQYNLNKLEPSNLYLIRMRAQNQLGFSTFSNTIFILTKKESPSLIPQNVTCTSLNSRSIRVSWQIPKSFSPFSADKKQTTSAALVQNSIGQHISYQLIEGFYVGYRIAGNEESFNFNFITVPTSEQLIIEYNSNLQSTSYKDFLSFNYTLDQLRKSTKYVIVVQAFNSEGASAMSNEVFANTFNNDPPKPINIRLENIAHHNVTIGWKKLPESNQVQGFILNFKPLINNEIIDQQQQLNNQDNSWDVIKLPKFYRRYTLTNLNCGTRYLVQIIAYNEIGQSEPSNELSFSTKGSLPLAPSRLAFIQPNITSALIYLSAWRDDNECPLIRFQIQYKQKNEFQWKFQTTIQVSNGLIQNNLIQTNYQTNQNLHTEYHITNNNELPIKTNNIYQSNLLQIPSISMASTYGQLILNDLQAGTWHDLMVEAYNQAGKTSTNYMFSTLTTDGAELSPLIVDDQLNVSINNDYYFLNFLYQYSSFTFVIIVFTLLIIISGYVIYIRTKLQRQSMAIDQFSRHHQDTVSLNSYSNKVCSSLPIKTADIYDTHNLSDNNQSELCDNCDQTAVYYPSIYATDPLHLAAQQMIPNFLSTNNLSNNKTENNYHTNDNTVNLANNLTNINNISNSLGTLLNTTSNTLSTSNCIHTTESSITTDYEFVDKTKYCTNQNCSSVLNNQLNTKVMNILNSQSNNCILNNHTIDNRNSSHVYDIPHRQQQALNELQFNKLKQMSTFRNIDQF